MFDVVPPTLQTNVTSSITYASTAPLAEAGTVDAYFDLNDTALAPFAAQEELPPPDQVIELNVFFATMDDGINRAMFNNVTYNSPLVPSILTELTMGNLSSDVAVYGPQSFILEHNQVFEIRLFNWDAGKHPFHLHGHKFQVVYKSFDVTSDDPIINPPRPTIGESSSPSPKSNPLRRDTIQVPATGAVYLRVVADNPGAWFFHCHIDWHLSAGLAVTLLEAPIQAQSVISPPPSLASQCLAQGLPASGNAAGHFSTTDFQGLTVGPFPQKLGWLPKGIGAMAGCVLSAVFGMLAVGWYEIGTWGSDEEIEEEERVRIQGIIDRGGGIKKRAWNRVVKVIRKE
ncbi:hypothetical protein Clacol_005051 [Clathrus columnatus]|uniref:Plastocyanin-like domain-containing protein n=1 Tax=Clathrus columnatus TaxID=1419009 RepID=A0AAV5ACF5_9AGAM|nr:hypothetical protein Clacol_005051 [Clathrus columnatus]